MTMESTHRLGVLVLVTTSVVSARADEKLPGPLRAIPGVHSVAVHPARTAPTHRIIHIRDWHFVHKADFAADLRDLEGKPLSRDEINARYEKFLTEVESVQAEQRQILQRLIKAHGISRVYIEGLTVDRMPAFQKRIEPYANLNDTCRRGERHEQLLLHEYRLDLLRIGAAGRLHFRGELEHVLPAEDAEAYRSANPVGADERIVYDDVRNAAREDAIARELLKGPASVVVLGGDHDLTDNVARISNGPCEVATITMAVYQDISERAATLGSRTFDCNFCSNAVTREVLGE